MTVAQTEVDAGETARRLTDAHRQLLNDNSIQFELPTARYVPPAEQMPTVQSAPPPTYAPPRVDPSAVPPPVSHNVPVNSAPPQPAPAPSPDIPAGGGGMEGLMQVFLWIAAGIALLILLYWLFTFFRDRRLGSGEAKAKKERRKKETEEWRPEEEQAVILLDEADVLASQGRFDEAARLLLHRSIGEIDAHRPDLVRPAFTSRDIAGHPLLPATPAAAFARVAALVERSLFACRPLGADDWQACRAAYREFAFAEGWQG